MAMPPQERSKSLHNFSLPCLKWGNQRHLKCVKDPPPPDDHLLLLPPPPPPPPPHHRPSSSSVVVNGLIQTRPAIGNPVQHQHNKPGSSPNGGGDDSPSSRPWNLRTRRAACKAPVVIRQEENKISSNNNVHQKSPKRSLEIGSSSPPAKRQCLDPPPLPPPIRGKPNKLRVPLSKEEIEEDFLEIARIRPPRRPKKRPRIVQKYLDLIFPGLWLTEVTADLYKVPEVPES